MRKWRVVTTSNTSKCEVFTIEADNISFGDNYLQFQREGKWVLSVPHSRVQYFQEI